jgi:trk system potassium uptake protein TrkH
MLFHQKIHWKSIWNQIGLFLHVPASMAILSLIVIIVFKEWVALIPMITIAMIGFGTGQFLYRLFIKEKNKAHLWDAMIIAALSWLLCSFLAAIPFYWIAIAQLKAGVVSEALTIFSHPINALFEAISGYTSTGLTMLQKKGAFPYALYWWRSFLEWSGGLGLVVFILSLTNLNRLGFQLYYAEARTEQMEGNITQTAHWIWGIYLLFTVLSLLAFWFFGMSFWEALNHALTAISTGGFTLQNDNFSNFPIGVQFSAIVIMLIGSMSFTIHFQIIRKRRWKILWKNLQNRLLYFLFFGGWAMMSLLNLWNDTKGQEMESFFEWTSALTTCGFNTVNLHIFSPMVKLFLIMGMFIGGATGSTCGGFKIRRLIYLLSGVILRLRGITERKEKQVTDDYQPEKKLSEKGPPPDVDLPDTDESKRLYAAGVLFSVWAFTLLIGWFLILRWSPPGKALDTLFEVMSAMSNVGLTSGLLTPDFSFSGKCIFMLLMWLGRLEIIPAIILLLSIPMTIKQR